ncbi:PREDICTED: gastrotropin-like [Cyprinodon variegatus]|uniref:Fatty acid-binding protein, liver-type n=1 Tax=Cyprinodon variegatus TaxID=28743 RepID=A0A3Q2FKM0_CYPVA|nr:PREDICTED: gastrotropin-like [Cyprinodon variegatus]
MAFSGKWELESQEGYEEFCKLVGIPDDTIQKGRDYKQVTEVVQNGNDFTWTQFYPSNHKVTNTFSIGKEADMQTISGKKFKATVNLDGGKLTVSFPNYHQVNEISGGKLIETSTAGSVVLKRISKKI